jgi:hypothetical protein
MESFNEAWISVPTGRVRAATSTGRGDATIVSGPGVEVVSAEGGTKVSRRIAGLGLETSMPEVVSVERATVSPGGAATLSSRGGGGLAAAGVEVSRVEMESASRSANVSGGTGVLSLNAVSLLLEERVSAVFVAT